MKSGKKLYALLNYEDNSGFVSYTMFDITDNDSLDKVAYRVVAGYCPSIQILYRFNNPRRPQNPKKVPRDAVAVYATDVEDGRYAVPIPLGLDQLVMGESQWKYTMTNKSPLLMKFIYNGHLIQIKKLRNQVECTCAELVLFTIEKAEKVDEITNLKISLLTMYPNAITTLQEQPGNETSNDPNVFKVDCDLEEFLILMVFFTDTFCFSKFVQMFFVCLVVFIIIALFIKMPIV